MKVIDMEGDMAEKIVDDMAEKVADLYFSHFGHKHPDFATCKDCIDYQLGFCVGGADSITNILECMFYKALECEFFTD